MFNIPIALINLDLKQLRSIYYLLRGAVALIGATLKAILEAEGKPSKSKAKGKGKGKSKTKTKVTISKDEQMQFVREIEAYGKTPINYTLDRSECFVHTLSSGRLGVQTEEKLQLIVNFYGYATLLINQAYLDDSATTSNVFKARVQLVHLLGEKFTTGVSANLAKRDLATILNVCSQIVVKLERVDQMADD